MTQSSGYLDSKYYLTWRSKMISYPPRSGMSTDTNLEKVKRKWMWAHQSSVSEHKIRQYIQLYKYKITE